MSSPFKETTDMQLQSVMPFTSHFVTMGLRGEFELLRESAGLSEEDIRERAQIAQAMQITGLTPSTWSPTIDIMTLAGENVLLRKELDRINHKLAELEERMPEEKVIVLREISREQAEQEINQLFSSDRTLYYSDIAEELGLDLKLVVEICQELEEAGEIAVDDSA